MTASKVYFADLRTPYGGETMPARLVRLAKTAGIEKIDMNGKFVAIKIHFGELGNVSYIRPNYIRGIVDLVKQLGGKPFLVDCNTMYPGFRKNAVEHIECAWMNGFTPYTVDCPIIIGDGLKGTDDVAVKVEGCEYTKEALIGRAVMDADVIISISHFKGHEDAGFGGALKNIGMGCGSRAGKKDMHSHGKPVIDPNVCRGCRGCQKECANNGLKFDEATKKMTVNLDNCVGCGRCLGACNFDAISFGESNAVSILDAKIAEYTKAVLDGRDNFHMNLIIDVSPYCDCHSENDAPILPNIGMFASFDPVALDQACADACLAATPLPNTKITDNQSKADFVDHHDHFKNSNPESEWKFQLSHGEKIGLGTREYELIKITK